MKRKGIGLKSIPLRYRASIKFFQTYPPKQQEKLRKAVWVTSVEDRFDVWKKLSPPFEKIEKSFKDLVIQRNKNSIKDGYKSFLDYSLAIRKIPKSQYKYLTKNLDSAVNYSNKLVSFLEKPPSEFYLEFGNHCYLCLLKDFPFKDLNEIKNLIYSKDLKLRKIKDKINIEMGPSSSSKYNEKTDVFEVQINKGQNLRHQSVDLIHELSHTLEDRSKPTYIREGYATQKELKYLKSISRDLYLADFGEFLKVFCRVLFEIELYKNPHQNLAKLYAKVFNYVFCKNAQRQNRSFILDEEIINNPFSNLPHAIAQTKIILNSKSP